MKTLETERLILRDWQETDLADMYEYAKVEGVGEMAGWPHHESIETSKTILDGFIRDGDVYAIVLKENKKVIGSLGIHDRSNLSTGYEAEVQREIGYVLSKKYWGNGLVPEATRAAIRYAFEDLNVDVLWCGHFLINPQSQRVIEKTGFKYYGEYISKAKALNKVFDGKKYILTKEDYQKAAEETLEKEKQMQRKYTKNKEQSLTAGFLDVEAYMKSCLCDVAHDAEHVYRVLNYAIEIAENEANAGSEIDFDILTVACLLHDIARPEQFADSRIDHAVFGGAKAHAWLVSSGYSEQFADSVKACIETHRFRSDTPPKSIEAKILFDADKLDACGAMGIARTLMHCSSVMKPLYCLGESHAGQDRKSDGSFSFLGEYKYKLEKLYDRFYTTHGSKLAEKRKAAAKNFYEALLAEVQECYGQEP